MGTSKFIGMKFVKFQYNILSQIAITILLGVYNCNA